MLYHCFLWLTLWTNTGRRGREDGSRDLWPDSVVCFHQSHGCWYFSTFPVPGTVMPGQKGQCRGVFASTTTLSWSLHMVRSVEGRKERRRRRERIHGSERRKTASEEKSGGSLPLLFPVFLATPPGEPAEWTRWSTDVSWPFAVSLRELKVTRVTITAKRIKYSWSSLFRSHVCTASNLVTFFL